MDGPQRGQPTPEFYRFIVSLLDLSGGTVPVPIDTLNEFIFTQSQASPATVDGLQRAVGALGARLAQLPRVPPDLAAEVGRISATLALWPRNSPDLTDAVNRLAAIVALIPRPFSPAPSPTLSKFTNSLSGAVALNNTANFFDGPSIAQGAIGTWFVSGTVTLVDTAGGARFNAKLWDGTTVIASGGESSGGANQASSISLSGYLASPAGNLRISAQDATATTGSMLAASGSGNTAGTISGFRIA
jgi:hypothetical protein